MFVMYISRLRQRVMKCLRLLLVLAMLAVLGSQIYALFAGSRSPGERQDPLHREPVRMEEQRETPANGLIPAAVHTRVLDRLWQLLEQYYHGRPGKQE
ncbi:hypothetical protein [Desulfotomaculum copahuensis]|uniref:Uncharacterized protein n=1 Tax=Desulfotomaculum copahuensis TaxID=1838280 RepID=A0A1B7LIV8_9FIRM|nr:hypothetical protein [Desulfotomaculum copahuensis]OAT86494.1 hypothetical protein A6M21_03505 [Desulfotomaculum copahuensis]